MPHIFIDESGQFGKDGSNDVFVVASFAIADPRRTYNRFQRWQREKFPRKLRNQPEIKFSDVRITESLRLKTLQHIAGLGVRVHFTYLRKENIPAGYQYKGVLKSGHLYSHVIAETVGLYLPLSDMELRVFCDQRHLKGISQNEFKQGLQAHLLPLVPPGTAVQVEMVDSTTNPNIQIADWIAGALSHYLNGKPRGESYYQVLGNNLIGEGKELFRNSYIVRL
jgi:hypothetical protein